MSHQSTEPHEYQLTIDQIRNFLPHRYPFLLVDRVLEIHPGKDLSDPGAGPDKIGIRVKALKNVTYNEAYFQGHFPDFSIMPGVQLLETMAQAASFTLYPYLDPSKGTTAQDFQCILVGMDEVRFRRPVVPGDTLILESVVTRCRGTIWGFDAWASVDGQKVCEAKILANLIVKGVN